MKIRVANLLPLLLMLLLAALTLWLRVAVEDPGGAGNGHGRHDADAIVDNFRLTRLDEKGAPQHVLNAAKMIHFADDDSTELAAPRLLRQGEGPGITITAKRGSVTRDGDEARFHDDVVVVRAATPEREALTVRTDYLHVLTNKNIARTDHPVTIVEGRSVLSGTGMEFDDNARRFTLSSRVRGHFDQARK
jgi:lipopolysaccharide export system protein LptC